jgi:hypothetical protein
VRVEEDASAADAFEIELEPAHRFDPSRMPVRIAAE